MKFLGVLLLLPAALYAQSVRVEVVSAEGGKPVRAAVVSLVADNGRTVGEGITTASGQRLLRAPAAGSYRVRVRRIGYAPYLSAPVRVGVGDATPLVVRVPSSSVSLAGVRIVAERKACSADSVSAMAAAEVWGQIQTALIASELTQRDSLVRTVVHDFSRLLRPDASVDYADQKDLGQAGARPFGTAEPAMLSKVGFALLATDMSATYYAPDARVLLSPEFEHDHCFNLAEGAGADSGLVGLAFTPAEGRAMPDIAGTLWVNRADASLQRLDFRYTNVKYPVDGVEASGRVDFASLPSGAWFPSYWVIRMPQFGRRGLRASWVLAGYKEMGGLAESADAGRLAAGRGAVTLRVSVEDAATGDFLDQAQVRIPSLSRVQNSDWNGETVFANVPMGTENVEVRRLGYAQARVPLLVQGDTMELHVILERQIQRLAPVHVMATVVNVHLDQFAMRRRIGMGQYLDETALVKAGMQPLPTFLASHFHGIKVVLLGNDNSSSAIGLHGGGLTMPTAGRDDPAEFVAPGTYGIESTSPGEGTKANCSVDILLNGMPFLEDLWSIPTQSIAAVELYTSTTVPPQYRRPTNACKVLLLWTKQ